MPGLHAGLGRLLIRMGGAEFAERRLAQAGWSADAVAFRARQLGWAAAGVVVGAAVAVGVAVWGVANPGAALLAPMLGAAGAALCEVRLTRAARRRRARIEEELPTVLEFLSLCLSAGEGLRDALRRVGEVGTGELTAEVRRVVLDSGTGSSLADALASVARRLDVPALTRAIDHIVAAMERGAPLAQVLQDQAADAREEAKRGLIELAGRKEIVMLLPLVFLLLPLSVLFAVFPGVVMLRLGVG
jgi:tight adherence protein C